MDKPTQTPTTTDGGFSSLLSKVDSYLNLDTGTAPDSVKVATSAAGRGYIKQFFDSGTWDEGMLGEQEKNRLKETVVDAVRGGKSRLGYEDYNKGGLSTVKLGKGLGIAPEGFNSSESLKKLLGNATIARKGDDLYVVDEYNFNKVSPEAKKAKSLGDKLGVLFDAIKDENKGMFDIAHLAGEMFGLSDDEGEGADIRFKIGSLSELGLSEDELKGIQSVGEYDEKVKKTYGEKKKANLPEDKMRRGLEPTEASSAMGSAMMKASTKEAPVVKEAAKPAPKPVEEKSESTYKIKRGDSLSKIAKKLGTSVEALAKKNGIKDVDKIYAGQTLKV